MSITIHSTEMHAFAIQFTFGENTKSIATYTIDCALDNRSSEMYEAGESMCENENGETELCTSYGYRDGAKIAAYLCFTGSDTNYCSINTFSEFAASIIAGKSANLTRRFAYDATADAIIIIAGDTGSKNLIGKGTNNRFDRDFIKLQYSLNGIRELFITNLDNINAQIKLAAQQLNNTTAL
jgi:hypothetical protein